MDQSENVEKIERELVRIRSQHSCEASSEAKLTAVRGSKRKPKGQLFSQYLNERREHLLELSALLLKARDNPHADTIQEISDRLLAVKKDVLKKEDKNTPRRNQVGGNIGKEKRLAELVRLAIELRKYSEESLSKDACQISESDLSSNTESTVPSFISFDDQNGNLPVTCNRIAKDSDCTLETVEENDHSIEDKSEALENERNGKNEDEIEKNPEEARVSSPCDSICLKETPKVQKKVQFSAFDDVKEFWEESSRSVGIASNIEPNEASTDYKDETDEGREELMVAAHDSFSSFDVLSDNGSADSNESDGVESYILESILKSPHVSGMEPDGLYHQISEDVLQSLSLNVDQVDDDKGRDSTFSPTNQSNSDKAQAVMSNVGERSKSHCKALCQIDPPEQLVDFFLESDQPTTRCDSDSFRRNEQPLNDELDLQLSIDDILPDSETQSSTTNEDKVTNIEPGKVESHPSEMEIKQEEQYFSNIDRDSGGSAESNVDSPQIRSIPSEVSIVKGRPKGGSLHPPNHALETEEDTVQRTKRPTIRTQSQTLVLLNPGQQNSSRNTSYGSNIVTPVETVVFDSSDDESLTSSLSFRCLSDVPSKTETPEHHKKGPIGVLKSQMDGFDDEYHNLLVQTLEETLADLKVKRTQDEPENSSQKTSEMSTAPKIGISILQESSAACAQGQTARNSSHPDLNEVPHKASKGSRGSAGRNDHVKRSFEDDLQRKRELKHQHNTFSRQEAAGTSSSTSAESPRKPLASNSKRQTTTSPTKGPVKSASAVEPWNGSIRDTPKSIMKENAKPLTSIEQNSKPANMSATPKASLHLQSCDGNGTTKPPSVDAQMKTMVVKATPVVEPMVQDTHKALRAKWQFEEDLAAKREGRKPRLYSRIKKGSKVPDAPTWGQLLGLHSPTSSVASSVGIAVPRSISRKRQSTQRQPGRT